MTMEDKNATGNAAAVENSATSQPAKKTAKSKAKAQRPKSSHPSTAKMVLSAIKELKDRKGSSVQAIKKYIASTYKVDGEKFAPFIKRYLKTAVTSGAVVQTKGKGASGSFKLPTNKLTTKKKVKRAPSKKRSSTSAVNKKPAEKKTTAAKKAPAAKKPAAAKKPSPEKKSPVQKKAKPVAAKKVEAAAAKQKAVAQAKNLSKTKKATKAPAAKTKTPKPKSAKAAPKGGKAAKK